MDQCGSTIPSRFLTVARRDPSRTMLLVKRDGVFLPVPCDAVLTRILHFGAGLKALGIDRGEKVALLSRNCPEWLITDLGTQFIRCATVPVYPTRSIRGLSHILKNSGASVLVLRTDDRYRLFRDMLKKNTKIKLVVLIDGNIKEELDGMRVLGFRDLEAVGAQVGSSAVEETALSGKPGDTASIVYTAGTMGKPKGVVLTQANFIAEMEALDEVLPLGGDDLTMSFLPLAHILQRVVDCHTLLQGASVAYAESIDSVRRDMCHVNPTVFVGVPRSYEKIRAMIEEEFNSRSILRRRMYEWARNVKKAREDTLASGEESTSLDIQFSVARALVFDYVRRHTGGRIRHWFSSGAPLAGDTAKFFRQFGIEIMEAYGLTEICGAVTSNAIWGHRTGTVGKAMKGCEVKIAKTGEILVRGPVVMKGYYRMKKETTSAIDKAGWFHTGDKGSIDDAGYLRITGRMKTLLVTAAGKNIAPMPIETALIESPYVSQAVVVGDRRKYLSALIVPDFELLERYARDQGLLFMDKEELLGKKAILDLYAEHINRVNTTLARFETIKRFVPLGRRFSIDNGELTPANKLRRDMIERHYRREIDSMYVQT